MHEQQGSICKYAVFWKLDKFPAAEKNNYGPKLRQTGPHQRDSAHALKREAVMRAAGPAWLAGLTQRRPFEAMPVDRIGRPGEGSGLGRIWRGGRPSRVG